MIFLQLILLQIKHLLCDFFWQNSYMLGKFKKYPDFIMPLYMHCLVHATATALFCFMFNWPAWFIFLDFGTHFIIDRLKAAPNLGGRWKPDQSAFWNALGVDQMAHHLIAILMVYLGAK